MISLVKQHGSFGKRSWVSRLGLLGLLVDTPASPTRPQHYETGWTPEYDHLDL